MTDPREIEGTPERAADRGRAEDLGFSMDSRPSLGDAGVVRGLVSQFASAVVEIRKRYNKDELTAQEAVEAVRDLSKEYGNIAMGRDKRYFALPWNSPERLGRTIKLVVPAVDGVTDPGELLFLNLGTSLSSLAAAHEDGRVTDADGERMTKDMLEDAAALILGVR